MSLLRIVLQKADSVLLDKNLKSYREIKMTSECSTYLDKKMVVQVLASRIFLVVVLYSTFFNQINSLYHKEQGLDCVLLETGKIKNLPFPYAYIYIK